MCEGIHIKKFKSGDLMLGMLKPYLKKAPKGQPSMRKTEGRLVLFIYLFFFAQGDYMLTFGRQAARTPRGNINQQSSQLSTCTFPRFVLR